MTGPEKRLSEFAWLPENKIALKNIRKAEAGGWIRTI